MEDDKAKFETGHFLSIEKYMQLNLEPVKTKLDNVNSALEKLAVSTTEHDQMKYQVASQSEMLKDFERAIEALEKKVAELENFRRIVMWIGGILTTIGIGLASRWIGTFFP